MRISLPALFFDAFVEAPAVLRLAVFAPFALADLYEPPAVVECRAEYREQARARQLGVARSTLLHKRSRHQIS